MDYKHFDDAISDGKLRAVDRAVSILWLAQSAHSVEGMTAKELARIMEEECGHPGQNVSRLHSQLQLDGRTAKLGKDGFRLRPNAFRLLERQHGHRLTAPRKPKLKSAGSVIPVEIFEQAGRTYFTRIVEQINGCYEYSFFDGVMVLGRRLLETLVIEVYQQAGRIAEIKRTDGSFLTFDVLVGKIVADGSIHVTRETKKALASMKKFGDQSAHNPKFTARQSDVDDIKQGIRIAAEELLNLCHFREAAK